jgi:protein SCO1/2
VIVTAAILAAFASLLWMVAPEKSLDLGDEGHVLPVARAIPEFELVDHRGETFDRSRLEGEWSLLFFGYTYCPDVCPMTLQSLARVQALMDPNASTQVVFVSVDPTRDTTARLAEYVEFFHPALVGASGDAAELERLTHAMGAFYRQGETGAQADDYLVDHSASLFLVDPQARLHAVLHEPQDPQAFIDLLERVQSVGGSS